MGRYDSSFESFHGAITSSLVYEKIDIILEEIKILPRCQAVVEIGGKKELFLPAVAKFRPSGYLSWRTP